MRYSFAASAAVLLIGFAVVFCGDEESAEDYAGYEVIPVSVCAASAGPFTLQIDNPFFPLAVGNTLDLEGKDGSTLVRVLITVLPDTEIVAGVETRVVEEREWEDGELVEVSRNYFAQAPDGTVCYFGEAVDDYSGGSVSGHDGAWRADEGDNQPGIIMPGEPRAGVKFQQEVAPGVAEDWCAITRLGQEISTPSGKFTDTLRAFDWNALEGDDGDVKFYVRDIGLVVDEVTKVTSYQVAGAP